MVQSPEQMIDFGRSLSACARSGLVITLDGPIGAGKTTLVKGLALGIGVRQTIVSPTFTLICEYQGDLPLFHVDLYRITEEEEVVLLGLSEMFESGGLTVIEHSAKARFCLPDKAVAIQLAIMADNSRRIDIKGDFS